MKLDQILDAIYVLPEDSKALLKEEINEINFPKGHILLSANKVENTIYFIKKGIVRAYTNTPQNQITFWFGKEGDPVISMKSYVDKQKGYEDIELLEAGEFFMLNANKLKELFAKDINIANWGRKFAELELVKTEERLISRQFQTAKERYQSLLRNNPNLILRVQLGHIASYLGITQVSLSRIRADKK